MKKTIFIKLATVLLFAFFCHSTQAQMFCEAMELTTDNFENIIDKVAGYYEDKLEGGDGYPTLDEAMDEFRLFLNDEITDPSYEPSCDPGPFWYSGYTTRPVDDILEYQLYFRWDKEGAPNSTYIAKVYNFQTGNDHFFSSDDPKGTFVKTQDHPIGKFVLLNTFCEDLGQSISYFIIIERDLNFIPVNDACRNQDEFLDSGGDELPIPRLAISATALKVYPNPSLTSNIAIDFDLPDDQNISIQLIAANSGIIVRNILEKEMLKAGSHSRMIESAHLATGLYYIVLQTEEERIVQKLIKL